MAETSYRTAVTRLTSLQSNTSALAALELLPASERGALYARALPEVQTYLDRLGISGNELAKLNMIHVTGTKGKGSTSAMIESILRAQGLKTGLFTSPHLLEPRERIKINGSPISESLFAATFFRVWDQLEAGARAASQSSDMADLPVHPMYFRYLTLMCCEAFIREAVDVAVIEVGIGGRHDATNVIPAPRVCAFASLGYDHMKLLGTTLPEIAWNKGGIIKPGAIVASVPQPDDALAVLTSEAAAAAAPMVVTGATPIVPADLSLEGAHQLINAGLAVAATRAYWESKRVAPGVLERPGAQAAELPLAAALASPLSESERRGLLSTVWPGRSQRVPLFRDSPASATLYVDGAHTFESMDSCASWFLQATDTAAGARTGATEDDVFVLLSACKPTRDPAWLMLPLIRLQSARRFDLVMFCSTDVRSPDPAAASTAAAVKASARTQEWLGRQLDAWTRICVGVTESDLPTMRPDTDPDDQIPLSVRHAVASGALRPAVPVFSPAVTLPSIEASLQLLRRLASEDTAWRGRKVHVLVAGSLYLVGGVLELLDAPVV